mgnify:CR=1 FL=1
MKRRVEPAAQQPSAQSADNAGRHIGPHHHIQAVHGEGLGQKSGQAGGQRRNEDPLQEPRGNEGPQIVRQRADHSAGGHTNAADQDDPLNRQPVRQEAKGQVGAGDAEDDGGDDS